MREQLDAAIARVVHDLRATLGAVPRLEAANRTEQVAALRERGLRPWPRAASRYPLICYIDYLGEPNVATSSFTGDEPGEEVVARLADIVQDLVMESRAAWGTPWPECPTHGRHPLRPNWDGQAAYWACPRNPGFRAEIGTLGS